MYFQEKLGKNNIFYQPLTRLPEISHIAQSDLRHHGLSHVYCFASKITSNLFLSNAKKSVVSWTRTEKNHLQPKQTLDKKCTENLKL